MALTLNNFIGFETGGLEEAKATAGVPDATEAVIVRSGARSLKLPATTDRYHIEPFEVTSAGDDLLFGFGVYFSNNPPAGQSDIATAEESATGFRLFHLRLEINGDLLVDYQSGSRDTISDPFKQDTWHYVEVRWQNVASGEIDIHVDGVSVLSKTGKDMLGTATFDRYLFRWGISKCLF